MLEHNLIPMAADPKYISRNKGITDSFGCEELIKLKEWVDLFLKDFTTQIGEKGAQTRMDQVKQVRGILIVMIIRNDKGNNCW